jgi:short-subunit dehydrogenase
VIVLILLKKYFSGGVFNIPNVDLSDKYAVVTGGNSGIGAETVKELSKLGCNVIIGARNGEVAEKLIKKIRSKNNKAKVEFIQLDLTSKASIESFAKSINFKQIDFLVNNAGVMWTP